LRREDAFRRKRSGILLDVVKHSGKSQNADRFPSESWTTSSRILDRFSWNHRTTSTGIRKNPQFDLFEALGINDQIGFRIRAGIGGVGGKGDDGKPKTTKVLGEIIQSYTPMADFDQVTFKPQATRASKAGFPAVRGEPS
jgi:hypothetical protein